MKFIVGLFLVLSLPVFGQEFKNITLLDNWFEDSILTSSTTVRFNDCWGFQWNQKEYAVLGSTEGTHFFEISNDNKLIPRDFVEGRFSSAQVVHRDLKSYQNYLYTVCDEGNSSLQIIDFSYLPDSVHLVYDQSEDVGRAHNLFIDEENQLLYAFKVIPILNAQLQPPHAMRVFSLANPTQPIALYSGPSDIAEVHDGYVRNNIAILNCGLDGLRRYDFSTPSTPVLIQNIPFYSEQGYNHQGWLNRSGNVYIFADETANKKLKKCSIQTNGDLTIESYFGIGTSEGSIPHNIMLDDQFAYVAYYNYGLRVFDYTKTPVEQVAFYDTYPLQSNNAMNGAWGIYSKLPSKRLLISDRMTGLYLFDFNRPVFENRNQEEFQVYPNPIESGGTITFFLNSSFTGLVEYTVYNELGQILLEGNQLNFNFLEIPFEASPGRYVIKVQYEKNQETKTIVAPIFVR